MKQKQSPKDQLKKPEFFYDTGTKGYWLQDLNGNLIPVNESGLKRHLVAADFKKVGLNKEQLSPLEKEIMRLQLENNIAFAGPVAGYALGLHEICGQRILVNSSPKLLTATPGEWPLLSSIIEGMLNDPIEDQRPYLFGWLKLSVEALRNHQLRPAQVLVFAGPANSFKSSFQNLITLMLGGRSAKPFRYMTGGTHFNRELIGAEHLIIEDEVSKTTFQQRRNFGSRIKDFTVNEVQSAHGKGRDALSLRPFWRMTISVNDEPENLTILPPIDESLADKIMLFRVKPFTMPGHTATMDQRTAFWQALVAELPAFLAFLDTWEIPASLVSDRFGVRHFHHPDILHAVDALSPEIRLLALIDAVLFEEHNPAATWQGTAARLEATLVQSGLRSAAKKLLNWDNATGTYLGRLAMKRPDRVKAARTSEARTWIINRYPVPQATTGG